MMSGGINKDCVVYLLLDRYGQYMYIYYVSNMY